jgi:hypothetical protein
MNYLYPVELMADLPFIGGVIANLVLVAFILILLVFLFLIVLYVYSSLCWYKIAKKLRCKHTWLAWIPFANYFLLPLLLKKHWAWGFMLLLPIANIVFGIIWCWKIFEKLKYSGAWSLLVIGFFIPFLSFFAILAHLIIIGFMAFSK